MNWGGRMIMRKVSNLGEAINVWVGNEGRYLRKARPCNSEFGACCSLEINRGKSSPAGQSIVTGTPIIRDMEIATGIRIAMQFDYRSGGASHPEPDKIKPIPTSGHVKVETAATKRQEKYVMTHHFSARLSHHNGLWLCRLDNITSVAHVAGLLATTAFLA